MKIADFGLAKLLGGTDDITLTATHQVMGTLHYMAPEQMERPLSVDHRADIYSLGVVFYEMLDRRAAARPFRAAVGAGGSSTPRLDGSCCGPWRTSRTAATSRPAN